ncbi:hypothetical protein MUP46_00075 [Patescibacteria group bacterium]|nr:hypothetical protein [Patescibacteria group bacterium]
MANYWRKLNLKIVPHVEMRAKIASGYNEDYIEASILQAASLEAALRTSITTIVGSRKKNFKKYWDGDYRFSQLIDIYELLGGRKALVERLRQYNKERNKIVHHIYEFKSIHELVGAAKSNFRLGRKTTNQLIKEHRLLE